MRKHKAACAAVFALYAASGSVAVAQDLPDMVGVWTGRADGIILGDPQHFESQGEPLEEPRSGAFDITITITHQEGRYIWGTISGGGVTEP